MSLDFFRNLFGTNNAEIVNASVFSVFGDLFGAPQQFPKNSAHVEGEFGPLPDAIKKKIDKAIYLYDSGKYSATLTACKKFKSVTINKKKVNLVSASNTLAKLLKYSEEKSKDATAKKRKS